MRTYTVLVHEAKADEAGYWADVAELIRLLCFGRDA